ncbi:LLM class flavin-dependent oxidoreductase [Umezawaea tangerina]|uniref:Alkanesulfonate monooxygenase SsuD/methylene tetrahydromethanopterin reductase-like flavin-dependent oxidoreductase (Luciferase family) n=1 Tax=Umezawaea tangerina TaxID=84725 RepID=A0A2T0SX02_9PSEU|nr:LLM class flavin-dependent oxidoreductase [Umezawaea tangerina]PRY37951.1 alkanesulfonate monooxygenase SsuD/methylene tetrahydromethanopterin reductase-like flavin-dependent oxidoreductase (luciferase family) [Umezawaea tangerina]
MPGTSPLHLAVALDGAGWHPAAWREADARPRELFSGRYWTDLVLEAERGLLDFVTIEDSLGPQSTALDGFDDRVDQVRGRLDAVLVAARVAPSTSRIGLVPSAIVTHTEPFHLSKAVATVDHASRGRAGFRPVISARASDAKHFGRRDVPVLERLDDLEDRLLLDLFEEAADYVEAVRRLWDSWEDDAEIRDAATGRFVDREKLHRIDFEGRWFSVRGPSITPRPPQGQPVVSVLAHVAPAYELAVRAADVVHVTPFDSSDVHRILREVRGVPHVFGELVVFLDDRPGAAASRKARLDELAGAEYRSDALVFTGTAGELADLLLGWREAGLSGFRLRPGAVPHDLEAITRALVPELQRRGAFRTEYEADTLRGLLGLPRPVNRYAPA